MPTKGAGALREWIVDTGQSYAGLGRELGGYSRAYLSHVAKGKETPAPEMAFALEDLSGGKVLARDLLLQGRDPLAICKARKGKGDMPEVEPEPDLYDPADTLPETPPMGKEKLSILVPADTVDRLRRIVWWNGGSMTLVSLVLRGLDAVLEIYEAAPSVLRDPETGEQTPKPARAPYPPRRGELPAGRKIGP